MLDVINTGIWKQFLATLSRLHIIIILWCNISEIASILLVLYHQLRLYKEQMKMVCKWIFCISIAELWEMLQHVSHLVITVSPLRASSFQFLTCNYHPRITGVKVTSIREMITNLRRAKLFAKSPCQHLGKCIKNNI